EQRQWMDAYVHARINYAAFGDTRLAAQTLKQMAQSQRADGLTMMAAPGDFALAGFTNIPDFCLYWIMMIADYTLYTGKNDGVDALFPSVVKAIRWFEDQLNDESLLTDVPHWVFVDWAELDKHGQVTALNAHFVAALRAATQLAQIVEQPREAGRFSALADKISLAINTLLWDEQRGVYADARNHSRLSHRISQQANAAVIAYGVAPRERWARIFETILDDGRLVLTRLSSREGLPVAFDEERNVVLAQPFYMQVLHQAMRAAGLQDKIVKNIRARWAAMLETGDSTFWENWQLEDNTSKCHAWSASPVFDLSTDVLGIAPVAPGFRRVRIAPNLAGLEWARGTYPTPHGVIAVEWKRDADRLNLKIDVPKGCEAQIICPLLGGWTMADGETVSGQATLPGGQGTHHFVG
ncbi:MAG TPA: alpha-L-rhamnosidase C-terminal domain-containing protein, partial [Rhizomicrobium sp.]|nr:alpha-L-rhamnosidase C-terminal domain-containing protein [Rhizomicrobium sp.]